MFADYLDGLQQIAESTFEDTFVAYRPIGRSGQNEETGEEAPIYVNEGETLGKIAGKSSGGDTSTRTVDIGGADVPVIEGGLHLPLDAPIPAIGWEYVCAQAGPRSDPAIQGRRYRVVDSPAKSYATARRLDVVEV